MSETVATNDCYGRVHWFNWGSSDAECIAAFLLESSLCLTELHLQTKYFFKKTKYFSKKSFPSLCQALSWSLQIRSLTVIFQEDIMGV